MSQFKSMYNTKYMHLTTEYLDNNRKKFEKTNNNEYTMHSLVNNYTTPVKRISASHHRNPNNKLINISL